MSIKVYTGRMGSGKTYEVVSVVILGAVKSGRRVVTNIAGLDFEAMRGLLAGQGADVACLGEIAQVEHERVTEPGFWLTDKGGESVVQPGDLLVLDEVWRFYDGFAYPPDGVMNFFRMHRHFTHSDTGVTCDVALITQDINDIGKKIRSVIEETYLMTKHTALGAARHYRVDVFAGAKKSRDTPIRSMQRAYDSAYFGLYKSHSQKADGGADAREVNIDGRGNLLKSPFFKLGLPLAIGVMCFSIYHVVGFFGGKGQGGKPPAPSAISAAVAAPFPVPSYALAASAVRQPDKVSSLLATSRARLAYSAQVGGKRLAKVEFIGDGGIQDAYSEDGLLLAGWRLYFGADGRSAILSNGQEAHIVSIEHRHRLPRMSRQP